VAERGALGTKPPVDAILESPRIHAVSFVAPRRSARYVYEACARTGKRVQALRRREEPCGGVAGRRLEFAANALIGRPTFSRRALMAS